MALKLNEKYPGRFSNPSADYPQGAFKNRTTPTSEDGSYFEQDWANDHLAFLSSLLSGAGLAANGAVDKVGASQYYDALRTIIQSISSSSSPVVGSVRNGRMSIASASATATYTADEIVVETALGGSAFKLAGFNKAINLATVGAGGMDVGSAPASGWVAIYAIYNPTSGVSALLAKNATSAVQTETYTGANMPSGYTASALVTVLRTNSSSQFAICLVQDRTVCIPGVTALSSNVQQPSFVSLLLSSAVPPNAKVASGYMRAGSSSVASSIGQTSSNSTGLGAMLIEASYGNATGKFDVGLMQAQTMYYTATTSSGTLIATIVVTSYSV